MALLGTFHSHYLVAVSLSQCQDRGFVRESSQGKMGAGHIGVKYSTRLNADENFMPVDS